MAMLKIVENRRVFLKEKQEIIQTKNKTHRKYVKRN